MKAEIIDGVVTLIPESNTEEFALQVWKSVNLTAYYNRRSFGPTMDEQFAYPSNSIKIEKL